MVGFRHIQVDTKLKLTTLVIEKFNTKSDEGKYYLLTTHAQRLSLIKQIKP